MGLFDTVILGDKIELPEFSSEPQNVEWQSKTIGGHPLMNLFKITNDGRLTKKEKSYRDMTDEEIKEMAKENGYDSWEEWEESDSKLAPMDSWKRVVDEEWWTDHNQHGSFEIHSSTKNIDDYENIYWSYEVRFTEGNLDDIILLNKKELSN